MLKVTQIVTDALIPQAVWIEFDRTLTETEVRSLQQYLQNFKGDVRVESGGAPASER